MTTEKTWLELMAEVIEQRTREMIREKFTPEFAAVLLAEMDSRKS